MFLKKIVIVIFGLIYSLGLYGLDDDKEIKKSQSQKKNFGSYQIPQDWVEVKQWSRGGKFFYAKNDSMSEKIPTNISIEMGKNPYSENDHEKFRYAILRQLSIQIQNSGSGQTLGGSGLNTKNGYTLYKFVIEDQDKNNNQNVKTVQYYIIGEKKHILVHLTDYFNKNNDNAEDVASFIVDSFLWKK
jgi:hypothetical protein